MYEWTRQFDAYIVRFWRAWERFLPFYPYFFCDILREFECVICSTEPNGIWIRSFGVFHAVSKLRYGPIILTVLDSDRIPSVRRWRVRHLFVQEERSKASNGTRSVLISVPEKVPRRKVCQNTQFSRSAPQPLRRTRRVRVGVSAFNLIFLIFFVLVAENDEIARCLFYSPVNSFCNIITKCVLRLYYT